MSNAADSEFDDHDGPIVDADWLGRHLTEVIVCDLRWYIDGRSGREAYAQGHIPGAVFIDLDADLAGPPGRIGGRHPLPDPEAFAEAMSRSGITNSDFVVVYDDSAGAIAARLWWMLDSVGTRAAVLDGGIAAWGGPLEHGPSTPSGPIARFEPRPWPPNRFVDADSVARRPASTVLIDARSRDRFSGMPNDIDPRLGHIPGAVNAPWSDSVVEGRLDSPSRLGDRFGKLGVGASTPVIASCGSGVTACHDLLALRVAGVGDHCALYTGSWSEWGADPDRPVEIGDGSEPRSH